MGTPSTLPKVTSREIEEVAQYLNHRQCVRLARALGFSDLYIKKITSSEFTELTPYRLLQEWLAKEGSNTTNNALCIALEQIDRRDLAELITAERRGEGNTGGSEAAVRCEEALRNNVAEMPSTRSRVVFCGPGRAGKSSTRRSFLKKEFQANLDSTPGVQISQVTCTAVKQGDKWKWEEVSQEEHNFQAALHTLGNVDDRQQRNPTRPSQHSTAAKNQQDGQTSSSSISAGATALDIDSQPISTIVDDLLSFISHNPNQLQEMSKKVMHFLDLWDCGGQQAFAAFQRFIISGQCCAFPIVYNASKDLTAPLNETYCVQRSERRILTKAKDLTTYDVIEGWLDILYSTAEADGMDMSNLLCYVVGCQVDILALEIRAEKCEQDKKYIQKRLKQHGKPYWEYITDCKFFFISNEQSGTDDEDPNLATLCDRITNDLMSFGSMHKIPVCWLPFAEAIRILQTAQVGGSRKVILSLREVSAIARAVCKITEDDEVTKLLKFFHRVGRILYFNHNKKLRNVVFIDMPGLVKLVTSLFIPPEKDWADVGGRFRSYYKMLYKRGVLLQSLMNEIWKVHCREEMQHYLAHLKLVFELMGEFGLLYETGREICADDDAVLSQEFLLPSMAVNMDGEGAAATAAESAVASRHYKHLCQSTILLARQHDHLFPEETFWQAVVHCLRSLNEVIDPDVTISFRSVRLLCNRGFARDHKLELTYLQCGVGVHVAFDPPAGSRRPQPINKVEICHQLLKIVKGSLMTANNKLHIRMAAWCSVKATCPHKETSSCHQLDCQHFIPLGKRYCSEGHHPDLSDYYAFWGEEEDSVDGAEPVQLTGDLASAESTASSADVGEHEARARVLTTQRPTAVGESAEVGQTSFSQISEEVPVSALTDLCIHFESKTECVRVAGKLGFEGSALLRWNKSPLAVEDIALDILLQWNASLSAAEGPKRSVIESALGNIRKDLARKFKELCEESNAKDK